MKKAAAAILFGAFLFSGAGCSGLNGSGSSRSSLGTELKPTQRFTLMNLNNEAVSLDQLLSQHKAVLLNFWATWCSFCIEEMPDLVKLQSRLESQGFTILGVDVGETAEQAGPFVKKMGLNFPIVLDGDNTVAQNYNLVGIPVSYLIGPDGKILGEYHGFSKKLVSDVEDSLKGLNQAKP